MGLLKLGQARHSFTNIFHIFYLTLLLYPTINSALAPYYLSLFCYYGLIFLPEAETLYYLVLLLRILLHDKCTFLHLGEDENVSGWTGMTADANSSFCRVYQTISTTQHSKSYVFRSTMVAPVQLGTYFLMNLASPFLSKLFHWQWQRYVVREHY